MLPSVSDILIDVYSKVVLDIIAVRLDIVEWTTVETARLVLTAIIQGATASWQPRCCSTSMSCARRSRRNTPRSRPARRRGSTFTPGRFLADRLGYPAERVDALPDAVVESFAGVGNPFSWGDLQPGETVVDLGSGAGFDAMLAAQMVGPGGPGDRRRHDAGDAATRRGATPRCSAWAMSSSARATSRSCPLRTRPRTS